jgi:hypothetical protein
MRPQIHVAVAKTTGSIWLTSEQDRVNGVGNYPDCDQCRSRTCLGSGLTRHEHDSDRGHAQPDNQCRGKPLAEPHDSNQARCDWKHSLQDGRRASRSREQAQVLQAVVRGHRRRSQQRNRCRQRRRQDPAPKHRNRRKNQQGQCEPGDSEQRRRH